MGNTPNNNCPYPEPTDLVKDGAQAIEDLAASIDTKLGVYSTPGMVKLASVAFSGVSSQSVNNVFSATYDNYRIFVTITSANTVAGCNIRLRNAGSDNSTTSYRYAHTFIGTESGQTQQLQLSNNDTQMQGVRLDNSTATFDMSLDIGQPFKTAFTTFKGQATACVIDGTNRGEIKNMNGFFIDSLSFDGFSLISTATFTGTVSVYGYNK
jgi:hypothetical protein